MNYQPIIGLEIHVQLKTKTKMFCSCSAHETSAEPNTNVCPVCLANPGVLPVPNEQAIRFGVLMGLALNCTIAPHSKFDRKNYFYPDLPKAYQISQYDQPIAVNGFLEVGEKRFGITRAHLEEDAAKSFHGSEGKTYVDYNRGGTPLIEIVTEPDFRSAQDAKLFLQELRLIARYLGVSDADMEKGHLRCDANVSLRLIDDNGETVGATFNPKTEVKNLNSFRHVERAIEHEIQRQTKLWEANTPPMISTTRGWNDTKQITEDQRSKEDAADYRYFPDPDIPALALTDIANEMRAQMPELPAARRLRLQEEYSLKPADARQICEDPALADFTESVFSELTSWLESVEDTVDKDKDRLAKLVSGWLLSKLTGVLIERSIDVRVMKITPENFAEFLTLIATKKLNNATGLKVLSAMLDDGNSPTHIMEELQLGQMDDAGTLADVVDRVIANNPKEVSRYQAGEDQLLTFLMGMVMKETGGTADAKLTRNMLLVKLKA
ncbi:MAG: Asp-tRNA(Asn)/Glu-tRNA(Gln) amidotransferase subunit GatB [Patescibacteria group bacterium]